jgi:hypothetical protein
MLLQQPWATSSHAHISTVAEGSAAVRKRGATLALPFVLSLPLPFVLSPPIHVLRARRCSPPTLHVVAALPCLTKTDG